MPFNISAPNRTKLKTALRKDTAFEQLRDASPAQIDNYIENNVTDLASAKEVLKKLARVCIYLLSKDE